MYRAHNEQLDRDDTQKGEGGFLMGIRNLGVALVLSVSMLWAQGVDERMRMEADRVRMDEGDRRLMEDERQSQQLKMELPSLQRGPFLVGGELFKKKKAHEEFKKARKAARKKKYEKALRRLEKATEIYPRYTEAFYEMGRIYLQQNRKEEAHKAFEQAIVANPKWVHSYHDQPQPLLETSNEILRLYPTLSVGHFFHSYVNLSMGRLEEAEKSALQADQHEHDQAPQIHVLLAKIYLKKGQPEEAEKQLRTFLAKRGSYARALYGKAIEAYEKAIALKPDAPGYHNNLGRVLAFAGNAEEAEKELSTAAELAPDKAARYFFNVGAVLSNNGRKEEAIEAFRKATEVDPNYAMSWYQLGVHLGAEAEVDEKTGKSIPPPDAVEALQEYLELEPDGHFAALARTRIHLATRSR